MKKLFLLLIIVFGLQSSEGLSIELQDTIIDFMGYTQEDPEFFVLKGQKHSTVNYDSVWKVYIPCVMRKYEETNQVLRNDLVKYARMLKEPQAQSIIFQKGTSDQWIYNSFLYRIMGKPQHLKQLIAVLPVESLLRNYERYDSAGLSSVPVLEDVLKFGNEEVGTIFLNRIETLKALTYTWNNKGTYDGVMTILARYSGRNEMCFKLFKKASEKLYKFNQFVGVKNPLKWNKIKEIIQKEQDQYVNRFVSWNDCNSPQKQKEWGTIYQWYQKAYDYIILLEIFSLND